MAVRRRSPSLLASPSSSGRRNAGSLPSGAAEALPRPTAKFRLAAVAALGVFFGANLLVSRTRRAWSSGGGGGGGTARVRGSWITASSQPFNQGGVAQQARHLIVVAGHSVTISGHLEDADLDERDWFLLDYQKHRGLPDAIVRHIQAGIQQADNDPSALLVFSGGMTRPATGPDTEGSSYYRVADAMKLWPSPGPQSSTVRARTVSEDFATDSFENFLFSLCRFREVTGSYPERVTIVSFTFKRRRFELLHAPALQWPIHRFEYVGVDPPVTSGFDLEEASKGELNNAALPFESDPYGCHSDVLKNKRRERNPYFRTPPYELSCPDLRPLLQHCGPELISKDRVPWKHLWRAQSTSTSASATNNNGNSSSAATAATASASEAGSGKEQ